MTERQAASSSQEAPQRIRQLLSDRNGGGKELKGHMTRAGALIVDPVKERHFRNYVEMWQAAERIAVEAANAAVALLDRPNSEMPRAFSPRTLAKRWQCSERHIRNLVSSGELPGWRAGGKLLRIAREDVESYERRPASLASEFP